MGSVFVLPETSVRSPRAIFIVNGKKSIAGSKISKKTIIEMKIIGLDTKHTILVI